MNDWAVIIVVYLTLFISSPLIAILHELGHAMAYLVFTKPEKINIYIGSYGQQKNTLQFKTGRLHFYIRQRFLFVKGIGLCQSSKPETDYGNFIIILLAGPFFTFFIAGILFTIIVDSDAYLLLKIACYIFLGLSFLSLLTNLIPRQLDQTQRKNLNSDGEQLVFTLRIKNALPDYVAAREYIADNEFAMAMMSLKNVLAKSQHEKIIRLLISTSLYAKQFRETGRYLTLLESKFKLLPDDVFYRGCLQSLTGQHDEAITTFSTVIKRDKNNILALNNLGYELIEKGAHQVAKRALDRAIKLRPTFDGPYGNMGYSKILQGELDEGKAFIDKCLQLNPKNAHAHKALGVYYLRTKNAKLSIENFNKAVELDAAVDIEDCADELRLLESQGIDTINNVNT